MIGLDTNVLVRYLTQDESAQAALSSQLIDEHLSERRPGFISLLVLAEVCWVLQRLYRVTAAEIVELVDDLLRLPKFDIEHKDLVCEALEQIRGRSSRQSALVDVLIQRLAHAAGCSETMTFDRLATRSAGMTLLTTATLLSWAPPPA